MSDENQILIPDSWFALHRDARGRLTAPLAQVRERYEFCEDLANLLTERGLQMLHGLGVSEDEVLRRVEAGLRAEGSGVDAAEAGWVVQRLAELLGWLQPESERVRD